jgi:hypothetical protein
LPEIQTVTQRQKTHTQVDLCKSDMFVKNNKYIYMKRIQHN